MACKPFQALVDAALAGSVLKPAPGSYAGPVVLSKPLTIEGRGEVVIDGGDKGTVFSLETDGAVLRGLTLTGSGDSHDTDDTCLNVRGHRNTIEDLVIDDCLFGIDLKQANDNVVRNNRVRSKPFDLGVRGDGIRLWYSMRNRIEGNEVVDSRDMVVWYSNGNKFINNVGKRSRYSIHFMFANDNEVEWQPLLRQRGGHLSDVHGGSERAQQRHFPRHRRHRHGHRLQGGERLR